MHQAHFLKRQRAIDAGCYAATNTRALRGETVASLRKKAMTRNEDLEKSLNFCLSSVRGSKQYWYRESGNLAVMDREFGPATFFLTLSCAEYHWKELQEYAIAMHKPDSKFRKMPLQKQLISDPMLVSEYFNRKFDAFMHLLLRPKGMNGEVLEGPLGIIDHYYWRLEYQARGAPHIHMKLWVRDAPILGKNDDKEVMEFISKYITCELPDPIQSGELRKLVKQYQVHRCGTSCKRFNPKLKIAKCRYGFPRATSVDYAINGVEKVVRSKASKRKPVKKMYELPRDCDETDINDYNPILLLEWRANMDLQYVGEKTQVLNYYITGYITKSEDKTTEEVWAKLSLDSTKSLCGKLKKLAHATFKSREIGAYEIADDLMGYQLHGSDVAIKYLGLTKPMERTRKLKPLAMLKDYSEDSTDIAYKNLVSNYYPARSQKLEDVCLHDSLALYEWCAKQPGKKSKQKKKCKRKQSVEFFPNRDGIGGFKLRKTRVYVKTNYIDMKNPERLCYQLLLGFVPWRDEAVDLLDGESTYSDAFAKWVKKRPELKDIAEKYTCWEKIQDHWKVLEAEAEAAAEIEDRDMEDNVAAEVTNFAQESTINSNGIREQPEYGTEEGLKKRYELLNKKQKAIYDEIVGTIEHQMKHSHSKCKCKDNPKQILKFVSGGAGVGKSKLIHVITEGIESLSKAYHGESYPKVVLAAPTGLAAQNIDGATIHSIFKLGVQQGKKWQYNTLSHEEEKQLHSTLGKCPLIIIDEISMVSNICFQFIHQRLAELRNEDGYMEKTFGGYNIVVLGDLLQLPPVAANYVFDPLSRREIKDSFEGSTAEKAPINLWGQFSYSELTENMRQRNDQPYAELLNKLRIGDISDIQPLLDRIEPEASRKSEDIADIIVKLLNEKRNPVCILAKLDKVKEVNINMLLKRDIKPVYIFPNDTMKVNVRKQSKRPPKSSASAADILKWLDKNYPTKANRTGGLDDCLVLGVNARVMLKRNLCLERNLFNGAMGTVKEIRKDLYGNVIQIIVKFDNGVEEVIERSLSVYPVAGGLKIKRKQFPLQLAYAITIHKSQGLSLECIVTDLGTDIFAAGMAYVCLSRVVSLEGLYLFALDEKKIYASLKAVIEYNELRTAYEKELPMIKLPKQPSAVAVKRNITICDSSNMSDTIFISQAIDKTKQVKAKKRKNAPRQPKVEFVRLTNGHAKNPKCMFCK